MKVTAIHLWFFWFRGRCIDTSAVLLFHRIDVRAPGNTTKGRLMKWTPLPEKQLATSWLGLLALIPAVVPLALAQPASTAAGREKTQSDSRGDDDWEEEEDAGPSRSISAFAPEMMKLLRLPGHQAGNPLPKRPRATWLSYKNRINGSGEGTVPPSVSHLP